MIFIDSNVPMYLVGAAHPNKEMARRLLVQAAANRDRLVTDAEVLQEILHRYVAVRRHDAIQPAFEALLSVVDDLFPIGLEDVQRAKEIVLTYPGLSARDAVHAATMERHGVQRILTFDRGFDTLRGVTRVS